MQAHIISAPPKLMPVLNYRDGFSPRICKIPGNVKILHFTHNFYWAVLDWLEEGCPGISQLIIEDAWDHACMLTPEYADEIFGWTLPFEILLNRARTAKYDYNAANDYVSGIYELMERHIYSFYWPSPLTYRRLTSPEEESALTD